MEIRELAVRFRSDFGDRTVTDHISFHVDQGETLGIVGESGCGKSVTSLAIMRLLARNGRVEHGQVLFDGKDLLKMSRTSLDEVRGRDISMIFQDALASLDPVFTVGYQVTEAIRVHTEPDKQKARAIAVDMLRRVGLPDAEAAMKKYPFALSGGMRQRVMIAMALSCSPRLVIADEATTALDVTIQSQIMRMIEKIRVENNMSMILITHDIGLIAEMSDRVIVMYAGQIVEEADVFELFRNPLHPYTQLLIAATPGITDSEDRKLVAIRGSVPENYSDLTGCRFRDRCPFATEACAAPQAMREIRPGHFAKCRLAGTVTGKEGAK
ncbi:MAG: ABC transporter ATP-binding protein [Lachnospiraceae bacterium]|nr:ABC transporter ATP-binding protein [Lachnospiraceae bacterium]